MCRTCLSGRPSLNAITILLGGGFVRFFAWFLTLRRGLTLTYGLVGTDVYDAYFALFYQFNSSQRIYVRIRATLIAEYAAINTYQFLSRVT